MDVTPYAPAYVPSDEELRSIVGDAKTIAVVGLSSDRIRASFGVAEELQGRGYRVIPVNPNETEILGEKAYASLRDVPDEVDLVDVFRRPEHTPAVAEEAVAIGAKALWLQQGIVNDEARRIAEDGGLKVVMGICIRDGLALLDGER